MNLKKSKYYLGAPNLKENFYEYNLSKKNIQCPILPCVGVYTTTQYAVSLNIPKFYNYANRKKSKYYLGTPMLKAKYIWI